MQKRSWVAVVVAVFALVVALSGTAMSAIIITKNGQVAAHTIAGASAPKGDNQNLIPGSVGTADLHTGAVTGKKLASNSVGSSKVLDGSLTGGDLASSTITASNLELQGVAAGLDIRRGYAFDVPGSTDPFVAIGPWTLTGNCVADGMGTAHATIEISAGGSPALLSVNGASGERFVNTAAALLASTGSVGQGGVSVSGGSFVVGSAKFFNHLEGQVMAAVDGNLTDFPNGPDCVFSFSGIGN